MAHYVVGHLRRSKERHADMEKIAASYGFLLPPGHTFVRPHARGLTSNLGADSVAEEIYRSRSAVQCLYEVAQGEIGGKVDWFQFEVDVKKLLEKLGFYVQHRSASRNGDGGVDIYAWTEDGKEKWAVQCKRYKASKTIGPEVIRELLGSLIGYPLGTKGMVVTTAQFSTGAESLAAQNGIMLINGRDWMGLIGATLH